MKMTKLTDSEVAVLGSRGFDLVGRKQLARVGAMWTQGVWMRSSGELELGATKFEVLLAGPRGLVVRKEDAPHLVLWEDLKVYGRGEVTL